MATPAEIPTSFHYDYHPIELELIASVWQRHQLQQRSQSESQSHTTSSSFHNPLSDSNPKISPTLPNPHNSYATFHTFSNGFTLTQNHLLDPESELVIPVEELSDGWEELFQQLNQDSAESAAWLASQIAEPTLSLEDLAPEDRAVWAEDELPSAFSSDDEGHGPEKNAHPQNSQHSATAQSQNPSSHSRQISEETIELSKRSIKRQQRVEQRKEARRLARELARSDTSTSGIPSGQISADTSLAHQPQIEVEMSSEASKGAAGEVKDTSSTPAQHKPLVVGRTKPQATTTNTMAESNDPTKDRKASNALNQEIEANLKSNTAAAAPAADATEGSSKKKEKAPKPAKAAKAPPPSAPLTPALIDLRVGHILRAVAHPNADSLYVSTIAMGDPEGTEHTQIDEATGKVVRTVCSGLNGLVPLEEMQDRKVVVVANLKPVNMRSIKSAAMVLAASPKPAEGADPHAHDRVVELVNPPNGSEAGDKVFFEGWPYGDGRGPEKQLNPKKKQWEAIQPGFYTSDDLVVGFDSSKSELAGDEKGDLIVEGKGRCTVKSLKGAVVR